MRVVGANAIVTDLFGALNKRGVSIAESPIAADALGELVGLLEHERAQARERIAAREAKAREAREAARMQALFDITEARDNAVALALVLFALAVAFAWLAARLRKSGANQDEAGYPRSMPQPGAIIAAGLSGACVVTMVLVWITRPGFSELEDRVAAIMGETSDPDPDQPVQPSRAGDGTLICTFIPERSRVTGARTDDVEFDWAADGCVNGRTQYGQVNGEWTRVFINDDETAVAINRYDPQTRIFQTDRYLVGRAAMEAAREARDSYSPPTCGVTDAARLLGEQQSAVISQLPTRPNERLVYTCEAALTGPTLDAEAD